MLRRGCGMNHGWRGLLATFFILWTSYGLGSTLPSSVRECGIWTAFAHLSWVDDGLLTLVQPYQTRVLKLAEEQAKAALGFRNPRPTSSLPRWDEVGETAETYLSARPYGQSLPATTRSQIARVMERGRPFEADLLPHLANQFIQRITRRADTDAQSPFYNNALMEAAIVVYLVGDLEAQERVLEEVMRLELASYPMLLVINESAPLLLQGDKRKNLLNRASAIRYSRRGMNLIGSEITMNTSVVHLFAAETERGQISSVISQINRSSLRNSLRRSVSYMIDATTLKLATDWSASVTQTAWGARASFGGETALELVCSGMKVQSLAMYLTDESPCPYNANYGLLHPSRRYNFPVRTAAYFTRIEDSRRVFLLFR